MRAFRKMKILGIDYGRAKVGLAIAEGPLAEPHSVVKVKPVEEAVKRVVMVEGVGRVVVGISENEMGKEQEEFVCRLQEKLEIPVETWDETLSTQDAQTLLIASGKSRKKRREMEDAYAATIMLQSYLDGK